MEKEKSTGKAICLCKQAILEVVGSLMIPKVCQVRSMVGLAIRVKENFAVVPFPHPDPYYHSLVAAYGNQTICVLSMLPVSSSPFSFLHVQSEMLGAVSSGVPLPLDLQQDEPIFVNAKQYQAILKRRQYRAKLEAQNRLSKGRKPYLHESRHRHALNRVRGPGGRFVNMKKLGEFKSPDLVNGQNVPVPDELQLNTRMLESNVHQPESYKGSYATPGCSGITTVSNTCYLPSATVSPTPPVGSKRRKITPAIHVCPLFDERVATESGSHPWLC